MTAVSTVTNTLHKTYDRENGFKFINQYCMLEEIGRGTFGKVRNDAGSFLLAGAHLERYVMIPTVFFPLVILGLC